MSTSKKQVGRSPTGQLLPGHTANPNGRPPKGYSITEAFKSMLGANPDVKAAIVDSIKEKAIMGDTTAQKLIWNYMDGMPKQGIELTGENGDPIETSLTVKFVSSDE